jgi:hypothetical protein
MGKRSTFDRRPQDAYDTPPEAVLPLIPHLPDEFHFWEPCAGDGSLIRHVQQLTHAGYVVCPSDIEPRNYGIAVGDALQTAANFMADLIITNPPWTRSILHPMIVHFSDMRPTWLLFDADWMHTRQAVPYLPRLRKIVSVGRVKWIPDSPYTGKDNCAWYLFDKPSDQPPQFYGRAA